MSLPVKIVMIEDDEGHARLIERNIRRSGVNNEILPFTNGSDAVKYLFGKDGSGAEHKDQALLILLDLNLPDMTGIDILKRIKENTHVKCAPVVVLTTTDDERNQALLRTGLQRLHYQAGQLRKLCQRHSPAGAFLFGHQGSPCHNMKPATPLLLYIDDDAGLARLVERGLRRQGFTVEHAPDGASGLSRIQQGGIDVVALDQHMPGLDGLETLAEIQKIPNAPPVIFVTASQDSKIAITALKAGSADYLVKDTQGEFLALLDVAAKGAIEQALVRKARDDAEAEVHASRDRYAALAAEREVLLREVNHRVGNSLQIIASLLHLQANSATDDDVKAALTNAMGRVAAVAQVHRRLYTSQDLKTVMLDQYLEALLEDLRRSAEGNRMSRLTLKAEPVEIDPDRAVAIGIIVNELVMNAVKYAYPDGAGPIHVDLLSCKDGLELSISDDGVGLQVKQNPDPPAWANASSPPWPPSWEPGQNAIHPTPERALC
jgi:two-component sensor histidine kinase